ncbi:MAG: response regulator [Pirellulales bacterium]
MLAGKLCGSLADALTMGCSAISATLLKQLNSDVLRLDELIAASRESLGHVDRQLGLDKLPESVMAEARERCIPNRTTATCFGESNVITATLPKTQIVVVEDDAAQARLLAHVLRKGVASEYELEVFTDPKAAAAHFETAWVDILITDLDMPVMNGLEIIKTARKYNSWVQSLLITAVSTSSSLVEAGDAGVTDYLLKPIDQQLLVSLVHQSLDRLDRWQEALSGTLRRCRPVRRS